MSSEDRRTQGPGYEKASAVQPIGWMRFRERGELLLGNRLSLKMKGKVYRCCVRSVILYGSESWCLKENVKAILRRTDRAMVVFVRMKIQKGAFSAIFGLVHLIA